MKISDMQTILEARVLAGGSYLDREVHAACGSDMMSDVLAYVKDQAVLITGLTNPQVVRTASMMDAVFNAVGVFLGIWLAETLMARCRGCKGLGGDVERL